MTSTRDTFVAYPPSDDPKSDDPESDDAGPTERPGGRTRPGRGPWRPPLRRTSPYPTPPAADASRNGHDVGWQTEYTRYQESGYRPGWLTRVLLWCGGVDRDLLVTRTEFYRYVNLGVFVLLIGVLAAISFVVYATVVTGSFSPWVIPAAAFWGLLIFFLDRSIVAEPSYGNLGLAEQRARRAAREQGGVESKPRLRDRLGRIVSSPGRFLAYLFRVVVAVLVAFLIGEALLLVLFRPEIDRVLDERQAAQFTAAAETFVAANQALIVDLDDQLANRAAALDTARAAEDDRTLELNAELTGTGGSMRIGDGDEAIAARERVVAATAERARLEQEQATISPGQQAERDRLQAEVTAVLAGDEAVIAQSQDLQQARERIENGDGWIEREAALGDFLRDNDSPVVAALPWIVRGLLLAIDLVPLVLKLASGATIYGQRQRDRAEQVRAADAAEADLRVGHLDRMAALDTLRSTTAADVAAERFSFHRDWRLTYFDEQHDPVRDRRNH